MAREISNMDDVIDSRDIIERIEELEAEILIAYNEFHQEQCPDEDDLEELTDINDVAIELWREDGNSEELWNEYLPLKALQDECEGVADWQYGEALIRDSYFTQYIMEMLSDTGDLPAKIPWYIVIDEEATARNCQADYMSVDFDGVGYLIRNC